MKEAFIGFLGAQWVLNPQPPDPQSGVPPIELWAPCFERADYITTFIQIQGFYGLRARFRTSPLSAGCHLAGF